MNTKKILIVECRGRKLKLGARRHSLRLESFGSSRKRDIWRCDCGTAVETSSYRVLDGNSKSCGGLTCKFARSLRKGALVLANVPKREDPMPNPVDQRLARLVESNMRWLRSLGYFSAHA